MRGGHPHIPENPPGFRLNRNVREEQRLYARQFDGRWLRAVQQLRSRLGRAPAGGMFSGSKCKA